jgi:tetracycline resistance efflux pump
MTDNFSLVSMFPPLVVLAIGYLTHRVILALSAGIVLAALLATNFAPVASLVIIAQLLWKNLEFGTFFSTSTFWDTGNLFICIFLLVLGVFVTMLQHSGGAYAYGEFARRKIKNPRTAETSSLVLSTGLFTDDYLSSLTVGSVMYPLTDTQHVPRAKLAYLVDSLSTALPILCPFSTWAAAIFGFLGDNGVSEHLNTTTLILANPLTTYVNVLPFLFYSFILVTGVWFIVYKRISFGIMKKHEDIAQQTGNLFGGAEDKCGKEKRREHNPLHTTLLEFFVPMIVLLVCVLGGILYSGGWALLGGNNGFMTACQQSSASQGLFIGGVITLIVCTTFFILRQRVKFRELPSIYLKGFQLMLPAVLVLMCAWTFGDLLREHLHTGEYLASLMLGSISITMLPVILFFAATAISFTIGTSWGTAAMLFPIAIPLVLSMTAAPPHCALSEVPMLFPVLGAVLSGCVAGNHVSPIADTTIMSSMSTHCKLKDHVCTQFQYALPGIFITGLAFLLSGILLPHYGLIITMIASLSIAIAVNILILWLLHKNAIFKTV